MCIYICIYSIHGKLHFPNYRISFHLPFNWQVSFIPFCFFCHLAGTCHCQLVFLGELIHSQDGNNVLLEICDPLARSPPKIPLSDHPRILSGD